MPGRCIVPWFIQPSGSGTRSLLARLRWSEVLGRCLAISLVFQSAPSYATERDATASRKLQDLRQSAYRLARNSCAQPLRVREQQVPNKHDPAITDTLQTTTCAGLEIVMYRANYTRPPREFLASLVLENSRLGLPGGLRLGMPRPAVEAAFGAADRESAGTLAYGVITEGPGADTISFRFAGGRLRGIKWDFDIE